MSDFTLVYDHFDPGTEGLRESLTSTGNGYFCTRGTAEWEDAASVHYPGTYVHGGFNRETTILGGRPVLNEDLVNLPNHLELDAARAVEAVEHPGVHLAREGADHLAHPARGLHSRRVHHDLTSRWQVGQALGAALQIGANSPAGWAYRADTPTGQTSTKAATD